MMNLDYSNKWDKKCPQIQCRKDPCTGLQYVFIPATMGDDTKESPVAPKNGAYCNSIVLYEATKAVYIYSKEGIPTKTSNGGYTFFNDIIDRPFYNGEMMTSSTSIPKVPDAVSELTNDLNYQTKNDVDAAILVETTARELADQTLQGEIDTIVASSDVKDIVGTYAELQAYDTSTLGNNDIIKVLQDETHNDAETYYRWSTSTETFTYIGELGPFYTKSETNTLLSGKQDTLTAGTNITIAADNTISSKAQTIFYMNSSESGSTRHIYKKSDMTDPATSQEVFDANDLGQVILRISTSVDPASYSDAYLQNAYKASGDYQLLFLDEKTYRSFDVTDLSSSTFTYSSRVLQDQLTAGEHINITGNVISAIMDEGVYVAARRNMYIDGTNGNDSNDGLSSSKPKKTLAGIMDIINMYGGSAIVRFKTAGTYDLVGGTFDGINVAFQKNDSSIGDVTINVITRNVLFENSVLSANSISFDSSGGYYLSSQNSYIQFVGVSGNNSYIGLQFDMYGSDLRFQYCTVANKIGANNSSSVRFSNSTVSPKTGITGGMIGVSELSHLYINNVTLLSPVDSTNNISIFSADSSDISISHASTITDSTGAVKYLRAINSQRSIVRATTAQLNALAAVATNGNNFASGSMRILNNVYVAGNETFTFTMVDNTVVTKNIVLGA